MKELFNLQFFAAEANTTVAADLAPAISIDHVSRITANIMELQKVLGISEMTPMKAGTTIKIYKNTQKNTPEQVDEGETIPLTEIERKLVDTIELKLKKFRKNTTAEAIQKVGKNVAINQTDEKLLSGIQKGVKNDFFSAIMKGSGKATGTNLQTALANVWAGLAKFHEDEDVTPVYFVSVDDVAEYLGGANVTMQTAFGLTYVENFLGLGTAIVSPKITKGTVVGVAKQNLNGAYVPANEGDVATSFGLTSDTTGLVGVTHSISTDNATIDTLAMCGVAFYPEEADGVIVGTITGA